MMEDIFKLRHNIGYDFKDKDLLLEALTHRSYASENNLGYDNQRLEFLGDAVLEIIFSEYLYRRYPKHPEGMLTQMRSALVRQDSLADIARELRLEQFIRMGKGELESGGNNRESTLCDLFEAMTGALYLEAGLEAARDLLVPMFASFHPDPEQLLEDQNPKGTLQELTQRKWGKAPHYELISTDGPDHDPVFTVKAVLNGKVIGSGTAGKRKTAETQAARNALELLERLNGNLCEKAEDKSE